MAKAFDLVHKVIPNEPEPESRIPFEDDKEKDAPKTRKRPKIEIAFFYGLLFIIFFVMGMTFLSPNLFSGILGGKKVVSSPLPTGTPMAGLTIDKDGQSVQSATDALGISPAPSTTAVTNTSTVPVAETTPTTSTENSGAAKIQVLNGTNKTGYAATMRTKLAAKGIVVASVGNYKSRTVKKTTIFYRSNFKTAATQVLAVTGGILSTTSDGIGSYDILVVLGNTN